jgi:hypothetical protein
VEDLRADYELLGRHLEDAEGSAAAAIARERRLIGEVLERLEAGEVGSLVDELAAKRSGSVVVRPAARRRKSG